LRAAEPDRRISIPLDAVYTAYTMVNKIA